MQVALDGGQSNVHDRDVHAQDEHAEAADGEDQIRMGLVSVGGGLEGSAGALFVVRAEGRERFSAFSKVSPT